MKHQQTNTHWPYDLSSAPHPAGYEEQHTFDRLAGFRAENGAINQSDWIA